MTDDRSLERAARSWLEEGPTRAPDRPVNAALTRIELTQQERDVQVPWRPNVITRARFAIASLVVGLLALGAVLALPGPRGPGATAPPAASVPSPSASLSSTEASFGAGTHEATEFAIPFSFTTPVGWAWNGEAREYTISPDLRSEGSRSRVVSVWLDPIPARDVCPPEQAPGVGRSADAIATWLQNHPGLDSSSRTPVRIGGLDGLTIDFRKTTTTAGGCTPEQVVVFLLNSDSVTWWPSNETNNRLTLLDASNDQVIAINISSNDPGGYATFLAAATPIVESFDFTPLPSPIEEGVYSLNLDVADILAALDADTTFTDAQKSAIAGGVMHIDGAATLNLRLTIESGVYVLQKGTDGGPLETDPVWQIIPLDDDTVAIKDVMLVRGDYGDHDVHWNSNHDGFRLTSAFSAPGSIEAFVVHTIFNTGEFQRVD